jgi:hypothetical protein
MGGLCPLEELWHTTAKLASPSDDAPTACSCVADAKALADGPIGLAGAMPAACPLLWALRSPEDDQQGDGDQRQQRGR